MRRLFLPLLTIIALIVVTTLIIVYGRGYRFNPEKSGLKTTGMLVTKSEPDGAQVFIDNALTTATNSTINLLPGKYHVKITKEAYLPWEKEIMIFKEVVAQTNAILFPSNPSLTPLTNFGIQEPIIAPDSSLIAFIRKDPEATTSSYLDQEKKIKQSGIYVLELEDKPISFSSKSHQILSFADIPTILRDQPIKLIWSPEAKEILAILGEEEANQTAYLLDAQNQNPLPAPVTSMAETLALWEEQKEIDHGTKIATLPKKLIPVATVSAEIISFSPDESKILYKAKRNDTLPQIITPPLIGTNPTKDKREIEKDNLYVYDLKEDRNYLLEIPKQENSKQELPQENPFKWFPTSRHLVYIEEGKIKIMEYDGTNRTTVYAGPFDQNLIVPWPNGSKIVILTTLNPDASKTLNLYAVNLR